VLGMTLMKQVEKELDGKIVSEGTLGSEKETSKI